MAEDGRDLPPTVSAPEPSIENLVIPHSRRGCIAAKPALGHCERGRWLNGRGETRTIRRPAGTCRDS